MMEPMNIDHRFRLIHCGRPRNKLLAQLLILFSTLFFSYRLHDCYLP